MSIDSKPESMFDIILVGHSSTSVNGTPPSAALSTDTPKQLMTQCAGTATDSTPTSIHNNTDLPRPTISSGELDQELDSKIIAGTENFSQLPESVHVKHIPDFQTGKVDRRKFPPKHYDLYSLEIGTWKVIIIARYCFPPKSDFIDFTLATPDDFTRQRDTPWGLKG